MLKAIFPSLFFLLFINGCTKNELTSYQGYVEGEYVNIASSQSGRLTKLFVKRGDTINASTPLFVLDSENETAQLRQNESELASAKAVLNDMTKGSRPEELEVIQSKLSQAKADAENFKTQLTRNKELYKGNALSQESLDNTTALAHRSSALVSELENTLKVAKLGGRKDLIKSQHEKIDQIQSLITQSLWRLGEKGRKSPTNALVFDTLYREGEFVPTGGIVVRLLPPQNRKIRFFVPEKIAEGLQIHQKVHFYKMNDPKSIEGEITYLSPEAEYTPPLIYSNESKNRLVFMVEAYPKLSEAIQFHPGQPIQVVIDEIAN
ncbi:MAG: HlyD family efflux transporter periplasmic adaptor subunit [Sulfuricurvum sp.]|nr:HlyD family efflux transporter periplasmic adaptor subunit [Sulfuricurvum sp.]